MANAFMATKPVMLLANKADKEVTLELDLTRVHVVASMNN
jgi:hypothetical protein